MSKERDYSGGAGTVRGPPPRRKLDAPGRTAKRKESERVCNFEERGANNEKRGAARQLEKMPAGRSAERLGTRKIRLNYYWKRRIIRLKKSVAQRWLLKRKRRYPSVATKLNGRSYVLLKQGGEGVA